MAERHLLISRRRWSALERDGYIGKRAIAPNGSRRTIVATYPDIPGGVRLDKPVLGFQSWSLDELRLFRRR